MAKCTFCDSKVHAKGLCSTHYSRARLKQPMYGPVGKGPGHYARPPRKLCQGPNCTRLAIAQGLCGTHRWRRNNGVAMDKPITVVKHETCTLSDCARPHLAKGLCAKHYHAANKKPSRVKTVSERVQKASARAKRKYGVTREEMHAAQGGRCKICSREIHLELTGKYRAHIDHCHTTGQTRGMLCGHCNIPLGQYEKHQRPAGLRITQYEDYLNSYQEAT